MKFLLYHFPLQKALKMFYVTPAQKLNCACAYYDTEKNNVHSRKS